MSDHVGSDQIDRLVMGGGGWGGGGGWVGGGTKKGVHDGIAAGVTRQINSQAK